MNSVYDQLIELTLQTRAHPMIGVTCMSCTHHYLYVFTSKTECVKYTIQYELDASHNERLIGVDIIYSTFDEVLIRMSHEVLRDGYARLEVIPTT